MWTPINNLIYFLDHFNLIGHFSHMTILKSNFPKMHPKEEKKQQLCLNLTSWVRSMNIKYPIRSIWTVSPNSHAQLRDNFKTEGKFEERHNLARGERDYCFITQNPTENLFGKPNNIKTYNRLTKNLENHPKHIWECKTRKKMSKGRYRTYLFNASEIKVKPGIDPRQQFIPPNKICTIHYPYIRHPPFFQSNNSPNKTFIYI